MTQDDVTRGIAQGSITPATPGAYLRALRAEANLSLLDLALCLETEPPVSAARRAEWLAAIEQDVLPVRISTALALAAIPALGLDLRILARVIDTFSSAGAMMTGTATIDQIAALAGVSPTSSHLSSGIKRLAQRGILEIKTDGISLKRSSP